MAGTELDGLVMLDYTCRAASGRARLGLVNLTGVQVCMRNRKYPECASTSCDDNLVSYVTDLIKHTVVCAHAHYRH
jgi:hypothetical protein